MNTKCIYLYILLVAFCGLALAPAPSQAADFQKVRTDVDFMGACTYYKVSVGPSPASDLATLDLKRASEYYGLLQSLRVEAQVPEEYTDSEPITGTCQTYAVKVGGACISGYSPYNATFCSATTECVTGTRPVTRTRLAWRPLITASLSPPSAATVKADRAAGRANSRAILNKAVTLPGTAALAAFKAQGYAMIRICGTFTLEQTAAGWTAAIDHVPAFKGAEYKAYDWWNVTFPYRKPIYINFTDGSNDAAHDWQALVNVTYNAHMATPYMGDLRFANNGSTDAMALEYWKETERDGSYSDVWLRVPHMNQTVYMYYGAAGINDTGNGTRVFQFFDDADVDLTPGGQPGNRWAVTTINADYDFVYNNVSAGLNIRPGALGTHFTNMTSSGVGDYVGLINTTTYGNVSWTFWTWDNSNFSVGGFGVRMRSSAPATLLECGWYSGAFADAANYMECYNGVGYSNTTISRNASIYDKIQFIYNGTGWRARIYYPNGSVGFELYRQLATVMASAWIKTGQDFSGLNVKHNVGFDGIYARNWTDADVNFTVLAEEVPPAALNITIYSPANTTYTSATQNLDVSNTSGVSYWQYSLDGAANVTFSPNTTVTAADGLHTLYVWANDSGGAWVYDRVWFTTDLLNVTIYSPANTTYGPGNKNLAVANKTGNVSAWQYSLDGAANVTFSPNTTVSVTAGGSHYIRVWINSSATSLWKNDTVWFTVDAAAPTLAIYAPTGFYSTLTVPVTYSVNDSAGVSACWHQVNGSANTTIGGCANTTHTVAAGGWNMSVWANDTFDNLALKYSYFEADTANLTIYAPANASYNTSTIAVNVGNNTPFTTWRYSLDGAANSTFTPNTTIFGVGDGYHQLIVWANSTATSKWFNDTVWFTVDTTPPTLQIYAPNTTVEWQIYGIALDYHANDSISGLSACWQQINGSANTTLAGCANSTFDVSGAGDYNLSVWANDTAGNVALAYAYLRDRNYTIALQTYDLNALEGSSAPFGLIINMSNINPTGELIYNYTAYAASSTVHAGVLHTFNRSVTIPNVSAWNDTHTFNWNFTASGVEINLSNNTQMAFRVALTNCSQVNGETHGIYIRTYDFENSSVTNASLNIISTVWNVTTFTRAYSFTFPDTGYNRTVCLYPSWAFYNGNLQIDYAHDGYASGSYFVNSLPINSTTATINIFLIKTASGSYILFFVKDTFENPKPNILLQIQKFNATTGAYSTVATGLTDDTGSTSIFLIKNAWYVFKLYSGATWLKTTGATYLTQDSYTIYLGETTLLDFVKYYGQTASSCTNSTAGSYINCSWNDSSGKLIGVQFMVQRMNLTAAAATLCNNVSAATSGYFGCNLSYMNGTYYYFLKGNYSATTETVYTLQQGYIQVGAVQLVNLGATGIFMAFMLLLVIAGAGYYKPVIAVPLAGVSIVISVFLGLIVVAPAALIGLLVALGVYVYRAKG